jgi:hypothetical protein
LLEVVSKKADAFTSVPDLEKAIVDHLEHHNPDPKPFVWTAAPASAILKKVAQVFNCDQVYMGAFEDEPPRPPAPPRRCHCGLTKMRPETFRDNGRRLAWNSIGPSALAACQD